MSAFDFYDSLEPDSPEFDKVYWTKSLWRVGPNRAVTDFIKSWPTAKRTLELCELM